MVEDIVKVRVNVLPDSVQEARSLKYVLKPAKFSPSGGVSVTVIPKLSLEPPAVTPFCDA